MKWKTHRLIAKLIGREFNFSPGLVEILSKGSIDPDIHPDYTYRVYGYKRVRIKKVV